MSTCCQKHYMLFVGVQPMVSGDGSDPREAKQWQQQQAAETELAAAEEAMRAGKKVVVLGFSGINLCSYFCLMWLQSSRTFSAGVTFHAVL